MAKKLYLTKELEHKEGKGWLDNGKKTEGVIYTIKELQEMIQLAKEIIKEDPETQSNIKNNAKTFIYYGIGTPKARLAGKGKVYHYIDKEKIRNKYLNQNKGAE